MNKEIQTIEKQKIYFPNLNGLRFIAAFLVIIHHIEQIKSIFNFENYWDKIPFIYVIGKLGVVLFFVLSGFLITYLLLAEEKFEKNINIKKFYIRRILRIWPLYFLMILLAFFVFPNISLFTLPGYEKAIIYENLIFKLILYSVFLSNLPLFGIIPYVSQTWSIGTEEQFYLVWPIILKKVKKNRLVLMFIIIFLYLFISKFLSTDFSDFIPHKNIIRGFWKAFNIDCMAIGAIFAILSFQNSKIIKILKNNYVFYFTVVLVIFLLIKGFRFPFAHFEFYAILFGILILNFATNPDFKNYLENKYFNYLGNISYGLYMYHPIGIVLSLKIVSSLNLMTNWIIYPLSISITILLAGLSYKYFESFFLKIKMQFSNILSSK